MAGPISDPPPGHTTADVAADLIQFNTQAAAALATASANKDLALATEITGITTATDADVAIDTALAVTDAGTPKAAMDREAAVAAIRAGASQINAAVNAPCFVAGTRITTARGSVSVEDLSVDDMVLTSSGDLRPIRWVGCRTVECRRHPEPADIMPIRIAAHAFGAHKPSRDLLVSPGHSICFDVLGEVLIPARALVNGSTVSAMDVDRVTYWHVELDNHDIIFAEDVATESYLDMGNRQFFGSEGVVQLNSTPDQIYRTHDDFCRKYYSQGSFVDVVRTQLRLHAEASGWSLENVDKFGGIHLIVDGVRVEPKRRLSTARFVVPGGAEEVVIVSSAMRPCEIEESNDDRFLGVSIAAITIQDGFGEAHKIDIDDPRLSVGFHQLEEDRCRWTTGRAMLPRELWNELAHDFFLCIDIARPALPIWLKCYEDDEVGDLKKAS